MKNAQLFRGARVRTAFLRLHEKNSVWTEFIRSRGAAIVKRELVNARSRCHNSHEADQAFGRPAGQGSRRGAGIITA